MKRLFTYKPNLNDLVTCWFRYVIGQPIEIDVYIVLILALSYLKLSR